MVVKKKIIGTKERPRLSVFRSNKHIYAQIIDDIKRVTLAAANSLQLKVKKKSQDKLNVAQDIGTKIAQAASKQGIKKVVFDRGRYRYHGRVKQVAEGARAGGLSL